MKRVILGYPAALLVLAGAGLAAQEHSAAAQPETRVEAQTRAGALFDKLDFNHDGKLDDADRAERRNAMFDRLDTNHDGLISRDEFAAAHHASGRDQPGPEHLGGDQPGGDHSGHMHVGHWDYGHRELDGLVMLIMRRADPGRTGTITRDAFVKAALSLFDQADTNHDGVLTPAEHHAAAEAMRGQMLTHHHGSDGNRDEFPPSPPPPPGT